MGQNPRNSQAKYFSDPPEVLSGDERLRVLIYITIAWGSAEHPVVSKTPAREGLVFCSLTL